MVLLTEQVRILSAEANLINDATAYTRRANGWATLKSYGNIVLASDSVIVVSYVSQMASAGGGETCAHRLKIGSIYVSGFQYSDAAGGGPDTVALVFFLTAGTYAVVMEGAGDYMDGSNFREINISNFKLGRTSFSDLQTQALVAYSTQINKTLTARLTPLGTVSKGVMHFTVMAYDPTNSVTLPTLKIDSVTISWQFSKTTQSAGQFSNCYGTVFGQAQSVQTAGASHAVTLTGGSGVFYISIVFTPWILPVAVFDPLTLNFPQGSTLYVVAEPLFTNPTKSIQIGKVRAVSFGDATDYYYTSSGTGILSASYVFESVNGSSSNLNALGYGGCISIIGVDVR